MPYAGPTAINPSPAGLSGWNVMGMSAWTGSVTSVKASVGTLGGYMLYNATAAAVYVQVFSVPVGSVTLGTTAPQYVIPIPAGSAANLEMTAGIMHTTITVAATTTATGSTLAALTGFILYK